MSSIRSRIGRNVLGAGAARILSLFFTFMSAPLLLHILGQSDYGRWAALTSVLIWITFFDFGVGNALRNTVAGLGVSTTAEQVLDEFFGLLKFSLLVFSLLIAAFLLLGRQWPLFHDNWLVACLLYGIYALSYSLALGNGILQGMGRVALGSYLQVAGTALFFCVLVGCRLLDVNPGIPPLATVFALSCALTYTLMFVLGLRLLGARRNLLAALWQAPVPYARIKLGIGFLGVQLCGLVLYYMGSFITYSSLGGAEAARFDLVNRVFQVGLSFFYLLISSVWAEVSRLLAQGDRAAIRRLHQRLLVMALGISLLLVLGSWLAPWLIALWTGQIIHVTRFEVLAVALMVSTQVITFAGTVFLNALEHLRLQLLLTAVAAALMLPLSHALVQAGLGIAAVPLAAAALTTIPMIAIHLQVRQLLRQRHSP